MIDHLVIFGYPRSGTSLLYCMLMSTVKNYRFYPGERGAMFANRLHPGINKVTKNPMDIKNYNRIKIKIANTGFILCIRDPRDVLCSTVSDGRFKIHYDYAYHRKKGTLEAGKKEGFILRHKFVREIIEAKEKEGLQSNVFICRYENLINNTLETQREIESFFELKTEGLFSDFFKSDNIPDAFRYRMHSVRPVDRNSIGNWRNFPERINDQFAKCPELFDILIELGYEKDKEWISTVK